MRVPLVVGEGKGGGLCWGSTHTVYCGVSLYGRVHKREKVIESEKRRLVDTGPDIHLGLHKRKRGVERVPMMLWKTGREK